MDYTAYRLLGEKFPRYLTTGVNINKNVMTVNEKVLTFISAHHALYGDYPRRLRVPASIPEGKVYITENGKSLLGDNTKAVATTAKPIKIELYHE